MTKLLTGAFHILEVFEWNLPHMWVYVSKFYHFPAFVIYRVVCNQSSFLKSRGLIFISHHHYHQIRRITIYNCGHILSSLLGFRFTATAKIIGHIMSLG